MTSLYGFVVILIVIVAVIKVLLKQGALGKSDGEFPYASCQNLCTPAERTFLGVLDLAVPAGYRVFTKVRLADLIKVRPGLRANARQEAFNRIRGKHVDYVLCRADDLSIAGAIELDDGSHGRRDRQDRDAFFDKALYSAGIPLVRFVAKKSYTVNEVKQALGDSLGIAAQTDAAWESGPASEPVSTDADIPDYGKCPNCGARLVKRIVKKGPHVGKPILVCSRFPKFRTVLPYREPEDPELAEIEAPRFRMT